jgi:hypothetical protein
MSRLPAGYADFASPGLANQDRFLPQDNVSLDLRAPKVDPYRAAGNVQYVGIVTTNHVMDPKMLQSRQSAGTSGKANVMGAVLNPDQLSVSPGEVLFKIAGKPRVNGRYDGLPVFSSFNGFEVPNSILTADALKFGLTIVGISKISYSYLPDTLSYDLMSSVVRGPATVINRGITTFAIGDLVRVGIYSVDRQQRDEELAVHQVGPKGDKAKLTAYLEKADYSSVERYAHNAAEQFVRKYPAGSARQAAFASDNNPEAMTPDATMTPSEASFRAQFSDCMKPEVLLAVATLAQHGIVTLNLPDSSNRMSAPVGELRKLNSRSDSDWVNGFYDLDQATGVSTAVTIAQREQAREALWAQLKTLAGILGVAKVPGIEVCGGLVQTLALRQATGLLTGPAVAGVREEYSLAKLIPESRRNDRLEQAIQTRAYNSARHKHHAHYLAHLNAHQFVLGTALNAASPGAKLDVLQ